MIHLKRNVKQYFYIRITKELASLKLLNIITHLLYILIIIIPLATVLNNNIGSATKANLMFLEIILITIILTLKRYARK